MLDGRRHSIDLCVFDTCFYRDRTPLRYDLPHFFRDLPGSASLDIEILRDAKSVLYRRLAVILVDSCTKNPRLYVATGTGFRSYVGESRQPSAPAYRKPWLRR